VGRKGYIKYDVFHFQVECGELDSDLDKLALESSIKYINMTCSPVKFSGTGDFGCALLQTHDKPYQDSPDAANR
jgi:hypothetical protein